MTDIDRDVCEMVITAADDEEARVALHPPVAGATGRGDDR